MTKVTFPSDRAVTNGLELNQNFNTSGLQEYYRLVASMGWEKFKAMMDLSKLNGGECNE